MDIKRAYRFRFYPTREQARILARTFGCARFTYNHMLRLRSDACVQRQERVGYHETSTALTKLKRSPEFAWPEFLRQLEYKAHWYGRTLAGIDRWFPSSKRCSDCGHTVATMPLDLRAWTCPECGSIHDRDVNAARNVLAAGLAVSAHGEAVSPVCMQVRIGSVP